MSDERLGRMETKLDKLSKAVVEMAKMEERPLTMFKRLEHMDAAFKKSMKPVCRRLKSKP